MSIRIVYGKAGSGKTEYIFNEIDKKITQNEKNKIYIITPEQFSFTAEKKLLENKSSVINTEVITFNRMAYRVLNEVGLNINNNLTKCGKAMIIYSILQKEKNKFLLLNKSDENIDLCSRTISEFKKNKIQIESLKKELNKIDDQYLKIKLHDMIFIYEKFEEKIKENYIDETDLLNKLEENIDKIEMFKNSIIYIDEFMGYTKQELDIIKKLINIAKEVTITFCIDNLELNTNPNDDVFHSNKITLNKVLNKLNNEEKIKTIKLDKLHRFKNEKLIFIEKYLYKNKIEKYNKNIKNVNLFLAKNKYSEIENIAKNIIKLVKEKKYKYNEIAIITKNINSYASFTKAIFSKYKIPVFIDEKKDINQNICIRYILSILEILTKNYSYDSIFNYLKNDFLEIDEEDIFKFEKYTKKYGIRNSKFKKDFSYGINENNENEINYLNELRKKIIEPLSELEKKINKKQKCKDIIKEFYLYLINENIEKKLNSKIKKFENMNNFELAKECKLGYEIIINIFDEMMDIFNNNIITLDDFYKILKIGLKNSSIGKIPSVQDAVTVGDTDRSRTHKVQAVFIIGLNDGVFPAINKNEGFFNDADRNYLKEKNIELAKGTLENIYDDNFNIYKAFTVSENYLFLSYCQSDEEGNSLRPSNLIFKTKKILIKLKEKSDILKKDIDFFTCEKEEYENFILEINAIKEKEEINRKMLLFYKYFIKNEKYKMKLINNINYIKHLKAPQKIKQENVLKLYGNKLNTSVSRLETFKSCPYEYFLQYTLKLKEQEELKIKNLDTGSFMHDVINSFFEELKKQKINIKDIEILKQEEILNEIIDKKLEKSQNYIFVSTEKYKLLVKRLKRIILKSIQYIIIGLKASDFSIEGTEISFGEKDSKYEPITINLENGKKIAITGKIDRIDIAKDEKNNYVRIIDYKSSIKNIDYTDIYAGLQLQLITYLDAVCKIEDFIPAGVLYFNLLEQLINSNKILTDEQIEEKIRDNFKMKGLILADVNVAKMQDKNLIPSTSSKIIPVYMDKDGNLSNKKSSIINIEEFQKLQQYVNKTIKEIAKEIFDGNISLKPYYKNRKTPCKYCAFRNMCGFNSGIFKSEYKFINKKTKEDILNN